MTLDWLSEALAHLVARSSWDWATFEMWATIVISTICILAVLGLGLFALVRRLRRGSEPRPGYSTSRGTTPDGQPCWPSR